MILNNKITDEIIVNEDALGYYDYDDNNDILKLEIINNNIIQLKTEYEKLNEEYNGEQQHCIINILKQNYDKMTYDVITKDADDIELLHVQKLNEQDIILSQQEKLIVKEYVEKWYKERIGVKNYE